MVIELSLNYYNFSSNIKFEICFDISNFKKQGQIVVLYIPEYIV